MPSPGPGPDPGPGPGPGPPPGSSPDERTDVILIFFGVCMCVKLVFLCPGRENI